MLGGHRSNDRIPLHSFFEIAGALVHSQVWTGARAGRPGALEGSLGRAQPLKAPSQLSSAARPRVLALNMRRVYY